MVQQGNFLPESAFSADSLMVSVQPPVSNRMHQQLCAHLNIPNSASHIIVWTRENTTHTDRNGYMALLLWLLNLHGAALVAAEVHSGKVTQISQKRQ